MHLSKIFDHNFDHNWRKKERSNGVNDKEMTTCKNQRIYSRKISFRPLERAHRGLSRGIRIVEVTGSNSVCSTINQSEMTGLSLLLMDFCKLGISIEF